MKATRIAGALFSVALCAPAAIAAPPAQPSAPAQTEQLSAAELQTLAHLRHTDREEIELGRLAQTNAGSADVKRYGQMLAEDHEQNEREILAFAKTRAQQLPEMPKDQHTFAKLRQLHGATFDREFLRAMIAGHEQALASLDAERATTNDPELSALLEKTQPVLEKHRREAQALFDALRETGDAPAGSALRRA
jgi:putative membrane protein